MKKSFIRLCFVFLICLFVLPVHGQTVQGLRLKRDYLYDNLDKVMDAIGADLNLRFVYDREHLHRYKTSFKPKMSKNEEQTVGAVLKTLEDAWDMVVLVSNDGYIYIARSAEHLEQLQQQNKDANVQKVVAMREERTASGPCKKNFTLTGIVSDISTSERIPYATVSVKGTETYTITDADGRYTLNRVLADTCTVVVDYLGYLSKEVALVPTEENNPVNIGIEQQPQEIAEVFIVGRKEDKALRSFTQEHKIKMAPEALKLLPNIGEKDILRGFQLMPGVSASNESSSGMFVRGGTPDQNLILYDGFTIYYVDHMHGFYSAFNSNAIKDVQLYKGGFEAKYGGRLSSVTEITAKDGNRNNFTVGGEVSLLSMNAYAEIPMGDKVTSIFAFRRSYQGYLWDHISGQNSVSKNLTAVKVPKRFGGDNPAYFYDINAKVTYRPSDNDMFSVSIFNGADHNDNTPRFGFGKGRGPGGPPGGFGGFGGSFDDIEVSMDNSDYETYGNFGTSLRWGKKVNERLNMNALVSFSNFYATRDQMRTVTVKEDGVTETTSSGTLEKNDLYDISFKNDWRYQVNDNNVLEAGLFGTMYDISYRYTQNGDEELLNKQNDAFLAGVYVQDRIKMAENKVVITPGVRVNFYTADSKVYIEPRLNGSYTISPALTLNAATGLYYQYANRIVREDIMSGNTDFWILSDSKEIPVSSALHLNVGLNYDLPDYIFSVEGYYKKYSDISEYTLRYRQGSGSMGPGPGGESNTKVSENFYVGEGYATGVEFLAQKKAGKFSGWVSYTLGQVKYRYPEQSHNYYPASHDVTHEVKAVGIYKFGNFDFSATWICSTGRPYTAPIGGYQITSPGGAQDTYYAISEKYTYRLPAYHRLDLSGSWRFNIFGSKGRPNAIGVSLFNAYNRRNISAKQFQIVDGKILESNINYLSITPNMWLNLKF
ncbi:MAG: TonB-dependent receptor [Bacteroidales bacterium]|nr:TonB-dependent receptor [Bacteroidales bacterium]